MRKKVGLDVDQILLGSDIDAMTDEELAQAVEKWLSLPNSLGSKKHESFYKSNRMDIVVYMGDGINDAPSMKSGRWGFLLIQQ